MASILVFAAHPDDEVLGCGGIIARHAEQGDEVHVVIMAEGITSRPGQENAPEALSALQKAAHAAGSILGAHSVFMEGLPDNRMDGLERLEVIRRIEAHVARHRPRSVYTHHAGDVNVDHQVLHHAVVTACRPLPGHAVKTLLFFETPSSTEWQPPGSAPAFVPNWFVDISGSFERKIRALEVYGAEMRASPHPRSIEAVTHLARWRGATAGVEHAEAFMLGRQIVG